MSRPKPEITEELAAAVIAALFATAATEVEQEQSARNDWANKASLVRSPIHGGTWNSWRT